MMFFRARALPACVLLVLVLLACLEHLCAAAMRLRRSAKKATGVQPLLRSEVQEDMARGVGFENLPILAIQPQPVTPEKEAEEFRDFDLDGNGYIIPAELKQFFYELKISDVDDDAIFDKLDLDGNGAVSWQEFSTAADAEIFDFLERSRNEVTVREIEFVEDLYDKEFGTPMSAMRSLPTAKYNMRGEEITQAEADEKYLPGYGWFKGESPVVDELYKGEIMESPNKDTELDDNPGQHYQYSYGF